MSSVGSVLRRARTIEIWTHRTVVEQFNWVKTAKDIIGVLEKI